MATLPPTEMHFQVEFWNGAHPHDLNRLLTHLELGQVECDINTFIYPVMWPAARGYDPPINDLSLYSVPWDEELTSEKVIHFYVADTSLYNELATLAHHLHGQIGMVSHQAPRVHRNDTQLVVHQVPLIFMMELLGELSQQARDLDRRVQDLEATVQFLRNHLGIRQCPHLVLLGCCRRFACFSPQRLYQCILRHACVLKRCVACCDLLQCTMVSLFFECAFSVWTSSDPVVCWHL